MSTPESPIEIFYVTKYALTQGILTVYARADVSKHSPDTVYVSNLSLRPKYQIFTRLGKDAFRTLEEAQVAVTHMIGKRVSALQKQITRLEKLQGKGVRVLPVEEVPVEEVP